MVIRKLPDLSPAQVVRLQDELLANADQLFAAADSIVQTGTVRLARSLAILGLEESGKAIAVHERRVQMAFTVEGSPFRDQVLDQLWGSHEKKLEAVYRFLLADPYWFGTGPADPDVTQTVLGSVRAWSRRNSRAKEQGFYVELDQQGGVHSPRDALDVEEVEKVLERVHQIGWQLRLGEHIEGKRQDEFDAGFAGERDLPPNAAYRFNPRDADQNPFRHVGALGYEAETRELAALWLELYGEPEQD